MTAIDHEIVDFGSSANGRPDPGETFDLIATFKNFGTPAASVQVELETADPYLTIIHGSTDLIDIPSGATVDNSSDPFSIEVMASAPTGHIAEVSARITYTGGENPSDLMIVIGKFDYFVWDPTGDLSSGPIIAAALADLNYTGRFGQTLPMDQLDDFSTLWVSLGVYADNFVLGSGASEGPAIVDYMADGGCVYLEGGDIWAYDPGAGGFDFRPHFGITATDDGGSDLTHVIGAPGGFTEGMDFVYVGENSYIDHLNPNGGGFDLFSNSSPTYDCGIAADAGTHRTVGTSFEFGGLQDGAEPSTKTSLARAIMDFFEVDPSPLVFTDDFESGDGTAWSVSAP